MPPSSNIQWIDRATGTVAPCSAAEIMLRDNDLWPGIHIERWRCGRVLIEESIARTHIISVVAHQYLNQLEPDVRHAVLGNVRFRSLPLDTGYGYSTKG